MSETPSSSSLPSIDFNNPREVVVSFLFGQGWQIVSPDGASGFPAGGGLLPPEVGAMQISITPLDLASMTAPAAQAAIAKRILDLSNVAQALALAQVQFSQVIDQYNAAAGAG